MLPYGNNYKASCAQLLYASPIWRGFINAEETNRLQSILKLKKTIRRSYLPLDFNSLDELFCRPCIVPRNSSQPSPCAPSTTPSAQKNCLQFTQNYPWIDYPTSLFQSYA